MCAAIPQQPVVPCNPSSVCLVEKPSRKLALLEKDKVLGSVSGLAEKVAGHQGLQLQQVVGPDEKLYAQKKKLITNTNSLIDITQFCFLRNDSNIAEVYFRCV